MIFGKLVFERLYQARAEIEPVMKATPTGSNGSGGRDFAANPAQKLCRSPATVANPDDSVVSHKVIDFAALDVGGTVVAAAETGVARTGPSLGQSRRQVLRIGAQVERAYGIAPDLPGCRGLASARGTMLFARLPGWPGLADPCGNWAIEHRQRVSRPAADQRHRAAGIEDLHCFLRDEFRKSSLEKAFRFTCRPVGSSER